MRASAAHPKRFASSEMLSAATAMDPTTPTKVQPPPLDCLVLDASLENLLGIELVELTQQRDNSIVAIQKRFLDRLDVPIGAEDEFDSAQLGRH